MKDKNKIRVIFIVSENQKWGYQGVYEAFDKDEHFEPLILISLLDVVHKGKDTTRLNFEENYNFFKSKGMNVEYAYKDGKYLDLKSFNPDVVFYEQPWGLPKRYKPYYVSKFALTCYSDYGSCLFHSPNNYKQNFHKLLWKFFVDNKLDLTIFDSYNKSNSENCVVTGKPKLDVYFTKNETNDNAIWRDCDKIRVIYAPHHSIEQNSMNLATFLDNGKFILELAQKHPETTWIFKPHPQLKCALLNSGVMSEEEIDTYYKAWENVGRAYLQGSYFDIFKTSDIMITDCCSFLDEYLPTGKPIIHLINANHIEYNLFGAKIISQNYKAYNCKEIEEFFNELVINKNDYLKEARMKLISEVIDFSEPSSEKIINYLKNNIMIYKQKGSL